MKKTWKKILCSLMLAPCMFWATACGDPEDPDNLTTDLTVEQQQEAYTTLRTLASTLLDNDGSKDQVYKLNSKTTFKPSVDISYAGLNEESKTIAEGENYLLGNTVTRASNVYGAYKKNNIGYINRIIEENNGTEEGTIQTREEDIVRYSGNKYVLYKKTNEQKIKSYVDNTYAKNTIILDADYFLDNNYYYQVDSLFSLFENVLNFENYKDGLVGASSYFIAESKVNNAENLDFSEYVNYDYKFSITDGVYTFELSSVINLQNAPVVYLEDGYMLGDANIKLTFNSEKILSLGFKYSTQMIQHVSSESYFDGWVEQQFESDNYVKYINARNVEINLDFNASFDETYYNQNVSDYVGTGENGAVQNQLSRIVLVVNNDRIEIVAVCGENLMDAVVNGLRDYMLDNGLTFKSAVVDVVKQIFVTENDLVPSYDIEVYVICENNSSEYAPVSITVNIVGYEDLSGEVVLVENRNLYESIKAVWGLEDEQIVGIFSDAERTHKLSTDALVSEGMTIYVVLEDGWSPIPPEMR